MRLKNWKKFVRGWSSHVRSLKLGLDVGAWRVQPRHTDAAKYGQRCERSCPANKYGDHFEMNSDDADSRLLEARTFCSASSDSSLSFAFDRFELHFAYDSTVTVSTNTSRWRCKRKTYLSNDKLARWTRWKWQRIAAEMVGRVRNDVLIRVDTRNFQLGLRFARTSNVGLISRIKCAEETKTNVYVRMAIPATELSP